MSSFSYGKIIACSLIFLLLSVACGGPTGNPENGKRWFDKNNCSFCHGESGKNGKAPAIAGLKLGYGSFEKNSESWTQQLCLLFPSRKSPGRTWLICIPG